MPPRTINPDPLEEAFNDHAREVRRFLHSRVKCAETAADITQEAYLRLITNAAPAPVGNVRAFIFQVARNLVIDHVRSRARRSVFEEGLANLYAVTGGVPEPLAEVAAADDLARLHEGVRALPSQQREIFELCRFEGLAHKEIAARLGVSVSTIEKHMAAALDFLREHLER